MLFVKIENDTVTKVWDSPPPAEPGWREAVEVRPAIIPRRQMYSSHRFDLTKTPVQIVYDIISISVEARKALLLTAAESKFKQIIEDQSKDSSLYNATVVELARQTAINTKTQILACTTHDQLDAF